jgi:hypothetical protein
MIPFAVNKNVRLKTSTWIISGMITLTLNHLIFMMQRRSMRKYCMHRNGKGKISGPTWWCGLAKSLQRIVVGWSYLAVEDWWHENTGIILTKNSFWVIRDQNSPQDMNNIWMWIFWCRVKGFVPPFLKKLGLLKCFLHLPALVLDEQHMLSGASTPMTMQM